MHARIYNTYVYELWVSPLGVRPRMVIELVQLAYKLPHYPPARAHAIYTLHICHTSTFVLYS